MLRYITVLSIAALLLTVALKSHTGEAPADSANTTVDETIDTALKPEIQVTPAPDGGLDLRLRHRFAGSVSRAKLVYQLDGNDCTLDRTTNCQKRLSATAKISGDSYESEVELGGRLPVGFSALRLVLEDETGTHVVPVSLD